jgi:hypothetical protein
MQEGLHTHTTTMVADYLTPVQRNPEGMPIGLAYARGENLIYFRFYSTSANLTVFSLADKITQTLNSRGLVGPHDLFQRKTQNKKDREILDGR